MKTNTILHLGLGAFHRAHQAVYLNDLHQSGDTSWVLISGNLRSNPTSVGLHKAGGSYTLETIAPDGKKRYQTITAIGKVIADDPELKEVLEVGADSATKIISFTVTEAGYYLAGNLVLEKSEDITKDLKTIAAGRMGNTIYGGLYQILLNRSKNLGSEGSVSLMCCDNLRHNGDRFKHGMRQFLQYAEDDELLFWFEKNVTCPNGMVDRITPRPTPEVAERVKSATGKNDPNAIMGENFIQWVLEDKFIAGRPAWEKVGVEIVTDVSPYEEAKIRILNATHSCIAWAGGLVGYHFIHEGTLDPKIKVLAYNYVTDDTIPVLLPSPVDLEKYRDVVLERFSNAYLKDTNQRVAMDGFSKIPGFIVPTIRDCISRNKSFNSVIILPALFLTFLFHWHKGNVPFPYDDQVMSQEELTDILNAEDPVVAFVHNHTLWGDLAGNEKVLATMYEGMKKVDEFLSEYQAS